MERVIIMKNSALILIFPGETDMRVARDIKFILSQRATIEKYKVRDTAVTQCKRCWQFGHVQSHCRRPEQPDSVEQREDGDVWHVCYNCHEIGHTARQAKCPLFQLEIKKQKNRRQAFVNNEGLTQKPTNRMIEASNIKAAAATRVDRTSYAAAVGASSSTKTTRKPPENESMAKALPDYLKS